MPTFLLSRRWLLFALAVAVLGIACWRLGEWQFDRLAERRSDNRIIQQNRSAAPVDVREVMGPDDPVTEEEQWRAVTATGRYDTEQQLLVRYQTRDGRPGVTVVTPLVLPDGARLLVERGWLPAANTGAATIDVPPPPSGTVTVTGWARQDQRGDDDALTPEDGQVRLISSAGFAAATEADVVRGYVSVDAERPPAAEQLEPPLQPELDSGPHFFYGLQWWFFGALALAGFGYFAYVEARDRRRTR